MGAYTGKLQTNLTNTMADDALAPSIAWTSSVIIFVMLIGYVSCFSRGWIQTMCAICVLQINRKIIRRKINTIYGQKQGSLEKISMTRIKQKHRHAVVLYMNRHLPWSVSSTTFSNVILALKSTARKGQIVEPVIIYVEVLPSTAWLAGYVVWFVRVQAGLFLAWFCSCTPDTGGKIR